MKVLQFYSWSARLGPLRLQTKVLMLGGLVPFVSVIGFVFFPSIGLAPARLGLSQHAIVAVLITLITTIIAGIGVAHLMRPVTMTA